MYKSIFARPEPSMPRHWIGFLYLQRSSAQYKSGKACDDTIYFVVHLQHDIFVCESWDEIATVLNNVHSFCDPQYFDFPESMLPHFVQCHNPPSEGGV